MAMTRITPAAIERIAHLDDAAPDQTRVRIARAVGYRSAETAFDIIREIERLDDEATDEIATIRARWDARLLRFVEAAHPGALDAVRAAL